MSQIHKKKRPTKTETKETKKIDTSSQKVLVAYFSATGTTKKAAEELADVTDATLYEIKPEKPYTDEDLNYNKSNTRTTKEQNTSSARVAIASEKLDLSSYTTIYLGFPIWWGEEPRIMDTFVELYNFENKTIIPFCTSSSSGIGHSGDNLEKLAKKGNWLQGRRLRSNVSKSTLETWVDSLHA